MSGFYDELAPLYHLIHEDWDASLRRQGKQLSSLMRSEWPGRSKVLDVSCGIGTQAIGLAMHDHVVTASDLSEREVERARKEAARYGVPVNFSVCDMRDAHRHHGTGFDVVLSGDNSLPHLMTDDDILIALDQMFKCLAPGGACIITVRDYAAEPRGRNIVKPYGTRSAEGKRYLLFQVWDFVDDEHYDFTFFFVEENLESGEVRTHALRSKYYAISTEKLCSLMRQSGFVDVRRMDGDFYQPLLVGTKPLT